MRNGTVTCHIVARSLTCLAVASCRPDPRPPEGATKSFVGSAACAECHQDIYERWRSTLMANVLFVGLALALVVLVQQTAERGARLVYEQGVGVIGGS